MKDNNKGFTLIEIVISSVIIGLLLIGLVTAFLSVRTITTTSSKQDTAVSLSNTLLESFRNFKYSDITEANKNNILVATGFDLTNSTVDFNDDSTKKTLVFHNIVKDLGNFKATVEVEPSVDTSINSFNFPQVGDIISDSSVIIDTKTMTANYSKDEYDNYIRDNEDNSFLANNDNSYDNLVLQELRSKNIEYITGLYKEECRRIDELNEVNNDVIPYPVFGEKAKYGVDKYAFISDNEIKKLISKSMNLYTGTYNNYKQLDCYLSYKVVDNCYDIFGENNIEFKYDIYTSKYLSDLKNLYIIYEPTEFKSDNIILVNGKDSIEDTLKYNLFFIVGNKYNKDYVSHNNFRTSVPNLVFKYQQKNPADSISLYTNCENLDNSINMYRKSYDLYKSDNTSTKLYNIKVTINDEAGVELYSNVSSSILK